MKKLTLVLAFALVVLFSILPLGCAGAYVGVSVPVGYPYGGYGGYGGWGGPAVGVSVPIGRPYHY